MRCSSLTCRHCCCRVAFAIRNCSFRTRHGMLSSLWCASLSGGVSWTLMCIHLADILLTVLQLFMQLKTRRKSARFRVGEPGPVSRSLQPGICFFRPPAARTAYSVPTVHLSVRQRYGFTRVPLNIQRERAGSVSSPGVSAPMCPCARGSNRTPYLLVQACQHLWPVADNGVYQQFTC